MDDKKVVVNGGKGEGKEMDVLRVDEWRIGCKWVILFAIFEESIKDW